MIRIVFVLAAVAAAGGRPRCGGVLTAGRGVLHTPGFPARLPVPINCEWVIDAQNFVAPNTSIVVYFTQLYVHEGLTFTEYQVYDRTYQLDGRIVHQVNETNAVQVRWVQSFQSYLVITLKLDSMDSVHLRVLDGLLDVYGFNITYEITTGSVRPDSCSTMDCGFTGNCYDRFTRFSCDCFPGFAGPHCSSGPRSFCNPAGKPTCQNGGTCMHVGVSAVKCHCQKGFTGEVCQTPIEPTGAAASKCESCVMSCRFDGKLENACKCPNGLSNGTTTITDRVGFTSTMHVSNLPNLQEERLKVFIQQQISRTLKGNYTKVDVNVESIAYFRLGADVTFHLFAPRKDENRIRSILAKWADRGYIANLTITDKEFLFGPLLDLQSVSINQAGVIKEHDEFILSCVARGSPSMFFRWFKDGIFVNITQPAISHKWSRLIKDPHLEDQYTALLGVERSNILDGGTFTCQVDDFNIQQCLSRRVFVKAPPVIKVEPMSLTVQKGENFTIKCISVGDAASGKYTYSWTKNRELIPVRSDKEKYEILYPGGSILQVFRAENSVKYSCLVQDDAVSSEKTVQVRVVNPTLVRTCPLEITLELTWPETAPDADSYQDCPKGYAPSGYVRRSCTLVDGLSPVWRQPDYSQCTSDRLFRADQNLKLLRLGYETGTPLQILEECRHYLRSEGGGGGLLPGEGTRILLLVRDVISYSNRSRYIPHNITATVFDLVHRVLMRPNSLIDQEQVRIFQEVVNQQVETSLIHRQEAQSLAFDTIEFSLSSSAEVLHRRPQPDRNNSTIIMRPGEWRPHKTVIKAGNGITRSLIAVVIYRNLAAFLPTRSVIRLKFLIHNVLPFNTCRDGVEMEYEMISEIMRSWSIGKNKVVVDWIKNSSASSSTDENENKEGWFIKCATAEVALFAYSWNTTSCETIVLNSTMIRCVCSNTATLAILLTANNIQIEKDEPEPPRYAVLVGCCICSLSAILCTIVLTAHWMLKRSCIVFLKLQSSVSIAGVMTAFIIATISEPPQRLFVDVMAFIETLLLMGMSAHISTLLLLYIELVPKMATSKPTVIGISTGVPVIAVFGNHLAHRTMDVQLRSWWLITGTLAFNIFVIVSCVIVGLFLLLYIAVSGKLRRLSTASEKEAKILQRRVILLKRSASVFTCLVMTTVSSIIYFNLIPVFWWHYEFGTATTVLGLVMIVCYLVKSETDFYKLFLRDKLKAKPDGFFGVESSGSPLNFFTKEEAEVESESMPNRKPAGDSAMLECFPMTDVAGLPECVSGAMEAYGGHTSTIERYNHSPHLHRKNTTTFKIETTVVDHQTPDGEKRPDVIGSSKICTELDLVASHAPSIIITPEESIEQILTNADEWSKSKRPSQPEGKEVARLAEDDNEKIETSRSPDDDAQDNLDGMLDRISHDLDYLLNRGDSPRVEVITVRKAKPSIIQEEIIEEESEEEQVKVPEAITNIMRTNC